MKTFYKILFSICSTLVCTAHSSRAFAASCTLYSSAAIGTNDVIHDTPMGLTTTNDGCTTYTTRYYIFSGTTGGRTYYNPYYNCTACKAGYTKKTITITHTRQDTTGTTCTLSPGQCILTGCTTSEYCKQQLGNTKKINFPQGYAMYEASCVGGACEFVPPTLHNKGTYWTTNCGVTCHNAHYSSCGYLFSQGTNPIEVRGCIACPDMPYGMTYDTNKIALKDFNAKAGGGNSINDCHLTPYVGIINTALIEPAGQFDLVDSCYY